MKHPFRGNRVTINVLPVRGGWKPDIRINSSHASLNQGRRRKSGVPQLRRVGPGRVSIKGPAYPKSTGCLSKNHLQWRAVGVYGDKTARTEAMMDPRFLLDQW